MSLENYFLNKNNLFEIIKIIILLVVCFQIFQYKLCHPRQLVKAINNLPGLRLGFLYPFGHALLILPQRKRKTAVSCHVYDFIAYMGYNKLFAHIGITSLWQFLTPIVNVYKADSVEVILSSSTELKKSWIYKFLEPWLGMGLLLSYDEVWHRKRKLLTTTFHFNILKDFLPVINKHSNILIQILEKHTSEEFVDVLPLFSRCSLDIISETALGTESQSQTLSNSSYANAILNIGSLIFERQMRPWLWQDYIYSFFPSGRRFHRNKTIVHDFANKMIRQRKKEKLLLKSSSVDVQKNIPADGFRREKKTLIDLLLDEHIDKNSISETEIREEIDTFTFAGHDTTSIAMSWALYLIGLHPWVQKNIHDELDSIFGEDDRETDVEDLKNMKYLECVFKESLRLYPSVPVIGREVRKDLDFNGYKIPAGSMCMINIYLLHRDCKMFPNPEKFDPDRFTIENSVGRHPFAYVPFSAGSRNCIGQRFALMEEKILMSAILRKYKVRSLDPRDKVHEMNEITLKPEKGLRIQIRRRKHEFDFHQVYYRP